MANGNHIADFRRPGVHEQVRAPELERKAHDEFITIGTRPATLDAIADRERLVVLVHGTGVSNAEGLCSLPWLSLLVRDHLPLDAADFLICLWPAEILHPNTLQNNANATGDHLGALLGELREKNPDLRLDLVAKSVGARVALRALKWLRASSPEVRPSTTTLLAPAVPRSNVNQNGTFYRATKQTETLHVAHSAADEILKWATLVFGPVLGHLGPPSRAAKNMIGLDLRVSDHRWDHGHYVPPIDHQDRLDETHKLIGWYLGNVLGDVPGAELQARSLAEALFG